MQGCWPTLNQPIQQQHAEHRPDLFKQPVVDDAIVSWYHDVLAEPDNRVYIASVDDVPIGYIVAVIAHRTRKSIQSTAILYCD